MIDASWIAKTACETNVTRLKPKKLLMVALRDVWTSLSLMFLVLLKLCVRNLIILNERAIFSRTSRERPRVE